MLISPAITASSAKRSPGMVSIAGGKFEPLFKDGSNDPAYVAPFLLSPLPVTDGDFAKFVAENPNWRRDRISRLFVDSDYLSHWSSNTGPDQKFANRPVVMVSWFAAKAYCAWQGMRLPTDLEWQFAAYQGDANYTERLTAWYSMPSTNDLPPVGQEAANQFQIFNLYGPIWEWVSDFNSLMVSSDGRAGAGTDDVRFCGAGALSANDSRNYIGFMRAAFLSSLRASYTLGSLGFRCAHSQEGNGQ